MTPGDAKHIFFGAESSPKVGKSIRDVAESMTPEDFCDAWAKAGHVASAREPMNDGRHPFRIVTRWNMCMLCGSGEMIASDTRAQFHDIRTFAYLA